MQPSGYTLHGPFEQVYSQAGRRVGCGALQPQSASCGADGGERVSEKADCSLVWQDEGDGDKSKEHCKGYGKGIAHHFGRVGDSVCDAVCQGVYGRIAAAHHPQGELHTGSTTYF